MNTVCASAKRAFHRASERFSQKHGVYSQQKQEKIRRRLNATPPRHGGFIAAIVIALVAAVQTNGDSFYVSPNGNDGNSGTESSPFRTIERARDAVRNVSSSQSSDITVYLRGGRYQLNNTVRFTGQDSGRNGHRIIYRAYPGETPVLSGGRRVTGWSHYRDGIYRANAPGHNFRQLFVNDEWTTRARTNFARVSGWNDGAKAVRVPSHLVSNWNNLNQVEMVVMKHWHQSRFRIASFDASGDQATVYPRHPERDVEWLVEWPNREPNQAFYFENALEFLDEPGEWYLDRGSRHLYYKPRSGENMNDVEVIAPRLERLVEVNGANNVTFQGLHFKHSTWDEPSDQGFIGIQANAYRIQTTGAWIPSAVFVKDAHRVRFERNLFRHLGSGALELHSGTYRTEIIGNVIADVAANGISVYTFLGNRNPENHIRSRNDIVRNNLVTRVGQDYTGAVAIYGSYTDGLIIENNEISDSPYTGVNVGWGWTNQNTGTQNNRVRYNKIHGVMNLMDDGAGIYTLSLQHNTLIEENHIHDLVRNPWAGTYEITGLYHDEQSENITMRNNVVENLSGVNVYKQHRANHNVVHDNGPNIPNRDSIVANAGIQPPYRDIKNLLDGANPSEPSEPDAESGPWGDEPSPIPGRIQAQHFDHGGQGIAYHDSTSDNNGGAFRPNESVDIEKTDDSSGNYNVGWTVSGEWMQYTVNVEEAGLYDLKARVSALHGDSHFQVLIDGESISGRVDIPSTGGWQSWETVTVPDVALDEGETTIRIRIDHGNFNLNWFEFEKAEEVITVRLTSPEAETQFQSGEAIKIAATVEGNDIARVDFLSGKDVIGSSESNTHSIKWEDAPAGSHVLSARAITGNGGDALSTPVAIEVGDSSNESGNTSDSNPFDGAPAPLPGRIQAEKYDEGGQDVAYRDSTSHNHGGAFRPADYVDIEQTDDAGGGYNVGWVTRGEWLQYTVDVAESGSYDLHLRVATVHDGRFFHIRSDGEDITGRINIPNTGGWQEWETVTLPGVELKAGVQTLRIVWDTEQINFNYFEFESAKESSSSFTDYDSWTASHFSSEERDHPEVGSDAADPDGDGIPNLMEYALGGDPRSANTDIRPEIGRVTVGGKTYLTITFDRNPDAGDVNFIIEASTDMRSWSNGEAKQHSTEPNGNLETVTYRDQHPVKQFGQRYLRLRIERMEK